MIDTSVVQFLQFILLITKRMAPKLDLHDVTVLDIYYCLSTISSDLFVHSAGWSSFLINRKLTASRKSIQRFLF